MSGRELDYRVVDVFTDRPFAGNPLAVVLDADGLTTEQMQSLARQFNLSETVFPLASDAADYHLRIFTPGRELPFAGHPSVGAAWLLGYLGRLPTGERLQECGAGVLPITVTASGAELTGGPPVFSDPLEPMGLLGSAGLTATDLDPIAAPRRTSAGVEFAVLPVCSGALDRATPRFDLPVPVLLVELSLPSVRARVFAPSLGIAEDPATGAAALGLGVWLHASGLVGEGRYEYVIRQGEVMGRPATLRCSVTVTGGAVTRTAVSGFCALVASGRIRVP